MQDIISLQDRCETSAIILRRVFLLPSYEKHKLDVCVNDTYSVLLMKGKLNCMYMETRSLEKRDISTENIFHNFKKEKCGPLTKILSKQIGRSNDCSAYAIE